MSFTCRNADPLRSSSFPKRALSVLVAAAIAGGAHAEEANELDSIVVVSAAGFEQNINEAPATMSVITGDEIRDKSYTNITDALRNVAGVNIVGSGVEQGVSIRGMAPEYTLFLIDGRPIAGGDAFDLFRGTVGGNSVNLLPPVEAIERIEVIRGPSSSLYGTDAMGGIVNIITRKVLNEWSSSVSTQATLADADSTTSTDSFQSSLVVNAPLVQDKMSMQFTGGFQSVDESTYVGDGSTPEYKQKDFGTKFAYNLNEHNVFTLGNNFFQGERSRRAGVSLDPNATDADRDVNYSRSVRETYFVTHEGNYDRMIWNSYINYDDSANRMSDVESSVLSVNTQATTFLSRHTVTGGLNYKLEELEDGGEVNTMNPDEILERYHWAAYLEDEWAITPSLALTLSGRYDKNEDFGDEVSPKAYLVYHLTNSFILKGGVTSGFKVADLRSASPEFGMNSRGGVRLGNPDLVPETSLNQEFGFIFDNREMGLNTSITLYQTDYENKLTRTDRICQPNVECDYNGTTYPANPNGYTTTVNLDEAQLKGIEHTLDYRILDNLLYRHNYTYTESEYADGEQQGVPLNDNPKHMFNASLNWEVTNRLGLWSQINYRGETSGNLLVVRGNATTDLDPDSVHDAYYYYDVGLNFTPKQDMSFNFGVYNVENKEITIEDGYSSTLDGRRYVLGAVFRL